MRKRNVRPIALTIAGSDSGGGAGIQADLKVFAALEVHGTSVITCLTAQNPKEVRAIEPASPAMVRAQLEAIFSELRPAAIKTGMLYSAKIIKVLAEFLESQSRRPLLVIDPVMISTSRKALLEPAAKKLMVDRLFPLAALITPNLDETNALLGADIRDPEELRLACRQLQTRFGCAVLQKGGHLDTGREALDFFYDGSNELLLSAPRVKSISTHGTGCTYSAAITAFLARGYSLVESVARSKDFISHAIATSYKAGKHDTLNISMC